MAIKMKEKSMEVFNFIKENGGRVNVEDIKAATGRTGQSVGASITDLKKKSLVTREEEPVEGSDKPAKFVILTDEGFNAEVELAE